MDAGIDENIILTPTGVAGLHLMEWAGRLATQDELLDRVARHSRGTGSPEKQNPLQRQTHTLDQIVEAWVAPKRVHARINMKIEKPMGFLIIRFP